MLKFINFEILDKKNPFSTDILLNFEDKCVDRARFIFIKDRLDNYNLYTCAEYSMTYEAQYDEFKKILSMAITITVPKYLLPKDTDKLTPFIMILIGNFRQFHQRTILFFNNKKEIVY
jgi:hypothetical protein